MLKNIDDCLSYHEKGYSPSENNLPNKLVRGAFQHNTSSERVEIKVRKEIIFDSRSISFAKAILKSTHEDFTGKMLSSPIKFPGFDSKIYTNKKELKKALSDFVNSCNNQIQDVDKTKQWVAKFAGVNPEKLLVISAEELTQIEGWGDIVPFVCFSGDDIDWMQSNSLDVISDIRYLMLCNINCERLIDILKKTPRLSEIFHISFNREINDLKDEFFNGIKLDELKKIDMRGGVTSRCLKGILNAAPNLEDLLVEGFEINTGDLSGIKLEKLKKIYLHGHLTGQDLIKILESSINLEEITLHGFHINEKDLSKIKLEKLKKIYLQGHKTGQDLIKILESSPNLEKITLDGFHINEEDLSKIKLEKLKDLWLCRCKNLTNEGLSKILKSYANLEVLSLPNTTRKDKDFKNVPLRNLKKINLRECKWLNDKNLNVILTNSHNLREIDVSNTTVTGEAFINVNIKNLKKIKFTLCRNIEPKYLKIIIESYQSLETLDVIGCPEYVQNIALNLAPGVAHTNINQVHQPQPPSNSLRPMGYVYATNTTPPEKKQARPEIYFGSNYNWDGHYFLCRIGSYCFTYNFMQNNHSDKDLDSVIVSEEITLPAGRSIYIPIPGSIPSFSFSLENNASIISDGYLRNLIIKGGKISNLSNKEVKFRVLYHKKQINNTDILASIEPQKNIFDALCSVKEKLNDNHGLVKAIKLLNDAKDKPKTIDNLSELIKALELYLLEFSDGLVGGCNLFKNTKIDDELKSMLKLLVFQKGSCAVRSDLFEIVMSSIGLNVVQIRGLDGEGAPLHQRVGMVLNDDSIWMMDFGGFPVTFKAQACIASPALAVKPAVQLSIPPSPPPNPFDRLDESIFFNNKLVTNDVNLGYMQAYVCDKSFDDFINSSFLEDKAEYIFTINKYEDYSSMLRSHNAVPGAVCVLNVDKLTAEDKLNIYEARDVLYKLGVKCIFYTSMSDIRNLDASIVRRLNKMPVYELDEVLKPKNQPEYNNAYAIKKLRLLQGYYKKQFNETNGILTRKIHPGFHNEIFQVFDLNQQILKYKPFNADNENNDIVISSHNKQTMLYNDVSQNDKGYEFKEPDVINIRSKTIKYVAEDLNDEDIKRLKILSCGKNNILVNLLRVDVAMEPSLPKTEPNGLYINYEGEGKFSLSNTKPKSKKIQWYNQNDNQESLLPWQGEKLNEIQNIFVKKNIVSLEGLPGIGKSVLAVKYFLEHGYNSEHKKFIVISPELDIPNIMTELVNELKENKQLECGIVFDEANTISLSDWKYIKKIMENERVKIIATQNPSYYEGRNQIPEHIDVLECDLTTDEIINFVFGHEELDKHIAQEKDKFMVFYKHCDKHLPHQLKPCQSELLSALKEIKNRVNAENTISNHLSVQFIYYKKLYKKSTHQDAAVSRVFEFCSPNPKHGQISSSGDKGNGVITLK